MFVSSVLYGKAEKRLSWTEIQNEELKLFLKAGGHCCWIQP